MRFIGNLIWLLLCGLATAISWFLLGLLWCITIIGIPFGKQCFKIAKLMLWPFGADLDIHFFRHPIANLIWMILGGFVLAIIYLIAAVLCCITVVGIPFGIQCFKMARLALMPFGATVN